MDFLNEAEKLEIIKFITNDLMREAVKKVLLADIYQSGIPGGDSKKNWVFGLVMNEMGQDYKQTTQELGEKVKACVEGIRSVELAFKELEKFKPIKIDTAPKKNGAR